MCIRDRDVAHRCEQQRAELLGLGRIWNDRDEILELRHITCLLYTSDAADERSSVDLGGRRIIKKKTKRTNV